MDRDAQLVERGGEVADLLRPRRQLGWPAPALLNGKPFGEGGGQGADRVGRQGEEPLEPQARPLEGRLEA